MEHIQHAMGAVQVDGAVKDAEPRTLLRRRSTIQAAKALQNERAEKLEHVERERSAIRKWAAQSAPDEIFEIQA